MIPFIIVASVLLIAGLVGVVAAKKRSRLAALALMPLLVGVVLFAGGAPSAQAAPTGVGCEQPTEPAAVPTMPAASPTPAPEECTPIAYDSIVPERDDWQSTTSPQTGIDGLLQVWDAEDAEDVATLVSASDMYPMPGVLTLTVMDTSGDSAPVEHMITVVEGVSPDEFEDWLTLSTTDHSLFVPQQVIVDAVAEKLPELGADWYLTNLDVVVNSNYLDGCGAEPQATITLGGPLPLS